MCSIYLSGEDMKPFSASLRRKKYRMRGVMKGGMLCNRAWASPDSVLWWVENETQSHFSRLRFFQGKIKLAEWEPGKSWVEFKTELERCIRLIEISLKEKDTLQAPRIKRVNGAPCIPCGEE